MSWQQFSANNFLDIFKIFIKKINYPVFFLHPLALLLFYREAQIEFRHYKDTLFFVATDAFGPYCPIWPWGYTGSLSDLLNRIGRKVSFIKGCSLSNRLNINLADKVAELCDYEYIYDLNRIDFMFKKRVNLIRRWEKQSVDIKFGIEGSLKLELLDLVYRWVEFKKSIGIDWQVYMAESVLDIIDFYFRLRELLLSCFSLLELVMIIKGKVVGFSICVIEKNVAFNLFEFVDPEIRDAGSFIFYKTCFNLYKKEVTIINTLGHSQIESLRYNKDSYSPMTLIPEYKVVIL